jgi:hypothetical protein
MSVALRGPLQRQDDVVARVRALARKYSVEALEQLGKLAREAKDERVRSKARAILDRGPGTPHAAAPASVFGSRQNNGGG